MLLMLAVVGGYRAIAVKGVAIHRADGEDFARMGVADVRAGTQAVGDVGSGQMAKIHGGLLRRVLRANQHHGRIQFVGHDLKVQPSVGVKTILARRAKFQRAAVIGADVERILVIVIALPNPERQADLFQIVDAGDFLGTSNIRKMIRIIPLLFGAAGKDEWH